MTLRIELLADPPTLVDVFEVHKRLDTATLADIERIPIRLGLREIPLAELFRVRGSASDGDVVWEGNLQHVNGIGYGMDCGRVHVLGNTGNHLGARMSGGCIDVVGDAGDWVGAEMRGGLIKVSGRAGASAGAAYPGSATGQSGGTMTIGGSCGDDMGRCMRRGLIAVAGDVGDRCAERMRAGSILVGGSAGAQLGIQMRRGTLTIGRHAEASPIGFRFAGRQQPLVLALLRAHLTNSGFTWPFRESVSFDTFHGDVLNGSRGELFVGR